MAMRNLKWHEKKFLKHTNLFDWEGDRTEHEASVIRRFALRSHEEYISYAKISRRIQGLVAVLKKLPKDDPIRIEITDQLIQALYSYGVLPTKQHTLKYCVKLAASSFCKRRLNVVVCKLGLAQKSGEAKRLIESGHIAIGPRTVTEPAVHLSRDAEDFVTWSQNSVYRRKIARFKGEVDDYELQSSQVGRKTKGKR